MRKVGSAADRVKAYFFERPSSHDLGSTRTLVTLLRTWIRHLTIITSAWRVTTANLQCEEVKRQPESLEKANS